MGSSFSCGIDSFSSIDNQITTTLFPNPAHITTAEIENLGKLPNYKFSYVTSTNKNKISMLEIKPDFCINNKIIVYSHGNGENLYTIHAFMSELANSLNVPIIVYDYIGYGASQGIPSEGGCYESIHTVVDYVIKSNPKKEVLLIGTSLGTGVVTEYITSTNWTKPVLLMAAYKSIPRVVADSFMIGWFFRHNHFDSINKIHKAKCPILFIHGKSDTLIPYQHSVDLYKELPNKKFTPLYYDGIGHNNILSVLTYDVFNKLFKEF